MARRKTTRRTHIQQENVNGANAPELPSPKQTITKKENPVPQKLVELEIRIIVSTGSDDTRSISDYRAECKAALLEVGANQVTMSTGYYLVNGKVCLEEDYDPATRDFKKGHYPPSWAGGPDEKEILRRIAEEKSLSNSMARNPRNLRTTQETDRLHALEERKPRTTAEALKDFNENTAAGRRRAAEKFAAESHKDEPLDDEIEDIDDEDFDIEDIDDDEALDDDLEDVSTTTLAVLKGKEAAPKRKIIKRKPKF